MRLLVVCVDVLLRAVFVAARLLAVHVNVHLWVRVPQLQVQCGPCHCAFAEHVHLATEGLVSQ